ncbi:hypothetical protein HYX19_00855 [Candidatus Woesearchaeota archaeon]|nr:hypothetical protein [Candidatus Woesearchaeota archaeon]
MSEIDIAYIIHPLKGDEHFTLEQNIERVRGICKNLYSKELLPISVALYFTQFMDDTKKEDRELGLEFDLEILRREFINKILAYGHKVSYGMGLEINVGKERELPLICKEEQTIVPLEKHLRDVMGIKTCLEIDKPYLWKT